MTIERMETVQEVLKRLGIGTYQELQFSNEEETYKCELCKDTGYIMRVAENGERISRPCKCEIERINRLRIEKSGLADLMEEYTFEKWKSKESWQKNAFDKAHSFLTDWHGKWFYIGGSVGCGKTHLCTSICGEFMKIGIDVIWFRWRDDTMRIKQKIGDADEYYDEVEKLKRVTVLYIDDFFKGSITEADKNLAFEILNARYNNKNLTTIISSERIIDEIMEIDEAIGSRIFQRSKDYCLLINGKDKNWRLKL